ncbi:OmpA family protein [Sulfuricurvum sp.]|uniref:OmpA family protein n=1 Tax=Sulfuricurvum sp. TaxID=2025608 RepID=UPI003BB21994
MMKNVAFLSATVAMLILSGCSSKEPAIDATANGNGTSIGTNANANGTSGTDSNAVIAPITNANANDAAGSEASASDSQLASILFDYDKFNIREDMQASMAKNALLVKDKAVKLEGNCDEFGSDEYNYALGLKRANAVKSELVNAGANADSITMVSFGEGNPVCLEKTQECWAKNRRVDFKLP